MVYVKKIVVLIAFFLIQLQVYSVVFPPIQVPWVQVDSNMYIYCKGQKIPNNTHIEALTTLLYNHLQKYVKEHESIPFINVHIQNPNAVLMGMRANIIDAMQKAVDKVLQEREVTVPQRLPLSFLLQFISPLPNRNFKGIYMEENETHHVWRNKNTWAFPIKAIHSLSKKQRSNSIESKYIGQTDSLLHISAYLITNKKDGEAFIYMFSQKGQYIYIAGVYGPIQVSSMTTILLRGDSLVINKQVYSIYNYLIGNTPIYIE